MGIFSGLKNLGLGDLEGSDLFAAEEKPEQAAAEPAQPEEKDFIYDKSFTCPVCDSTFTSRVMKTGKAKLVSMTCGPVMWGLTPQNMMWSFAPSANLLH